LQVFPKCGDGVSFVVTLTPVDGSEVQILHEVGFAFVQPWPFSGEYWPPLPVLMRLNMHAAAKLCHRRSYLRH
jgi:hypothetical protein